MTKIFLSHSSKDKAFVTKLANNLKEYGYTPWLDDWEIKVGHCILDKIENAIDKADFLILVLSKFSTQSSWVEKEWKIKYWEEVNKKNMMLLPVLIEDCKLPLLIKTKKYADFRLSYKSGLQQLIDVLSKENYSGGSSKEIITNNGGCNTKKSIKQVKKEIEQCVVSDDFNISAKMIVNFAQEFSKSKALKREALLYQSSMSSLQNDLRKFGRISELDIRQKQLVSSMLEFIDIVYEEYDGEDSEIIYS